MWADLSVCFHFVFQIKYISSVNKVSVYSSQADADKTTLFSSQLKREGVRKAAASGKKASASTVLIQKDSHLQEYFSVYHCIWLLESHQGYFDSFNNYIYAENSLIIIQCYTH